MKPTEINLMVASISNYLYECMPDEDFECLALFLAELSKSMFTMSVFERLCTNNKNVQHSQGSHRKATTSTGDDADKEDALSDAADIAGNAMDTADAIADADASDETQRQEELFDALAKNEITQSFDYDDLTLD